jgi:hypothetical protein
MKLKIIDEMKVEARSILEIRLEEEEENIKKEKNNERDGF